MTKFCVICGNVEIDEKKEFCSSEECRREWKNRCQDGYNGLIEKQVRGMIGSQRFGPTYVERFIAHYAMCPSDTRKFLRGFVYTKLQECENKLEKDNNIKEEKKLELYKKLFAGISIIKTII